MNAIASTISIALTEAIRPVRPLIRVAVAGLGSVGMAVARSLDAGIVGCELVAVAARDMQRAKVRLSSFTREIPVVSLGELEPLSDVVVECVPSALVPDVVGPFVNAGKNAIVLSCGSLLANDFLIDIARETGAQIFVPTGALIGLDAVSAAAEGHIRSVRMVTRKPPGGLAGAPFLIENGISLDGLTVAQRVFEGTAREAARGFPANLNVAVALSLAGIGPDRTRLEIWADPAVTRNTHRIDVDADSASFSMTIENVPSENPRTGRITALSVIACLRKMNAPLRVGT